MEGSLDYCTTRTSRVRVGGACSRPLLFRKHLGRRFKKPRMIGRYERLDIGDVVRHRRRSGKGNYQRVGMIVAVDVVLLSLPLFARRASRVVVVATTR